MKTIARIDLDLAKNVFQVHAVDAQGKVVLIKTLKRNKLLEFFVEREPCLVGMEALKARSNHNKAAVALAAKNARIIWAMLAKDTEYRMGTGRSWPVTVH